MPGFRRSRRRTWNKCRGVLRAQFFLANPFCGEEQELPDPNLRACLSVLGPFFEERRYAGYVPVM